MIGFLLSLAGLFAPLFTIIPIILEAKRGIPVPWWMNTTDDPTPPRGLYEPDQKAKYEKYGQILAEWWWLGFRNSLYGLAYYLKPDKFKNCESYLGFTMNREDTKFTRTTTVDGYKETIYKLGPIGIITGYRLSPIYNHLGSVKHPNMDGRPIFSIRKYENCL